MSAVRTGHTPDAWADEGPQHAEPTARGYLSGSRTFWGGPTRLGRGPATEETRAKVRAARAAYETRRAETP